MLEIQLVQWCGDSFVEVDDEHYNVQHGRVYCAPAIFIRPDVSEKYFLLCSVFSPV